MLTPVMTLVFFSALKLMEGRPDAIVPFLQASEGSGEGKGGQRGARFRTEAAGYE